MKNLFSKECLLLAINHKEPDCIPLCIDFLGYIPKYWSNQFQRAKELLVLSIDDILQISSPFGFYPEVKIRKWIKAPL